MDTIAIQSVKGKTIQIEPLYSRMITMEIMDPTEVRVLNISTPKEGKAVEGINGSRYFITITLGLDMEKDMSKIVEKRANGDLKFIAPQRSNKIVVNVFERTNPILYNTLVDNTDDILEGNGIILDLRTIQIHCPEYFPFDHNDVVATNAECYALNNDIITTIVRRKIRKFRWVSSEVISLPSAADNAMEAESEENEKIKKPITPVK